VTDSGTDSGTDRRTDGRTGVSKERAIAYMLTRAKNVNVDTVLKTTLSPTIANYVNYRATLLK